MATALRMLVGLLGLALFAGGLAFAFAPDRISPDFAVAATAVAGRGTLRADLGGLFVATALFTFAGLRRDGARWLVVPLAFLATILALRLLHLLLDGVTPEGLRSLAVEVVAVAILLAARRVAARDGQR